MIHKGREAARRTVSLGCLMFVRSIFAPSTFNLHTCGIHHRATESTERNAFDLRAVLHANVQRATCHSTANPTCNLTTFNVQRWQVCCLTPPRLLPHPSCPSPLASCLVRWMIHKGREAARRTVSLGCLMFVRSIFAPSTFNLHTCGIHHRATESTERNAFDLRAVLHANVQRATCHSTANPTCNLTTFNVQRWQVCCLLPLASCLVRWMIHEGREAARRTVSLGCLMFVRSIFAPSTFNLHTCGIHHRATESTERNAFDLRAVLCANVQRATCHSTANPTCNLTTFNVQRWQVCCLLPLASCLVRWMIHEGREAARRTVSLGCLMFVRSIFAPSTFNLHTCGIHHRATESTERNAFDLRAVLHANVQRATCQRSTPNTNSL
ncbi:MAG: hypothetical protein KatS3mg058_2573 [Roseiflexus sp.]|nr:MAG: hypothetical protein KatS3mg058_2573 [Roseiflexus sp.]